MSNTNNKLKDRLEDYVAISDIKLLPKIPVVITINGRNFQQLTSLIDKPYCSKFAQSLYSTMQMLCNVIDGSFFSYSYNDEIVIVCRNDNTIDTIPFLNNKIQKICSITSSIATSHFTECSKSIKLELLDSPLFYSNVFTVPNIQEAINTIIYKQQKNFHSSLQFACFYNLLKKYNKQEIKDMLMGLSLDEKRDLLKQEMNVDFNDYPIVFKRGAACYKTSILTDNGWKNKWKIDQDLPIFTQDIDFITNLFTV